VLVELLGNLVPASLALGFAILHGVIFAYHPRHRGNLYFALFSLGLAANGVLDSLRLWAPLDPATRHLVQTLNHFAAGVLLSALVYFLASLSPKPVPRAARWLVWSFLPVALVAAWPPLDAYRIPAMLLWSFASMALGAAIAFGAWRERVAGARILLISASGLVIFIGTELAKHARLLSPTGVVVGFGVGLALILGGASIFLARRIAHEGRELERLAAELEDRVAERTAELQRSEREALAASRAKSAFLATMSHEIRTPMNSVIGFADLLAGADLPEREREMAKTLRSSAVSLLHLIDEILDLSRIEAGRLELEARPFELAPLIADVAELFSPQASRDGLELSARVIGEEPPMLLGDPARLRQVLLNLVGNALKFTVEGSVELVAEYSEGELVCEVHDTGIGIDDRALEALFKPFAQADGSTTRRFGGAGLGLAICRGLCDAMGGTIEAQSEPSRGSTFRVQIPALPAPAGITAEPEEAASGDEEGGRDGHLRILLAEDNPVNQMVTLLMLERLGLQADTVEDGVAALDALGNSRYDLVLLDLHMPKMDGLEVARRLREHDRDTYVVALTASALEEDRERCREAGMDDFLAKPMQLEALRAALRRVERGRSKG